MSFEDYVGTLVILRERVPSCKRGVWLSAGTELLVTRMVGPQHFELRWLASDELAASQVHYSKLKTGPQLETT